MIPLENALKISLQDVLKMSWRRFCKTSWRRLEDVLKTYGLDEYIGLDQDVFWRRKTKANIFVLIKTSSKDKNERRLDLDECLLGMEFARSLIGDVLVGKNYIFY